MNESQSKAGQQDTTYIINTEDASETARLTAQAKQINASIGLFPFNVRDIAEEPKILDLGSGTGDWCLDVAFAYPDSEVIGLDISRTLVGYANARAVSQNIQNVAFEDIDVLKGLMGWPTATFDLIHLRFAAGWVPTYIWKPLLKECARMLKPGGRFISTEGEWPYTTSQALGQLNKLLSRAMWLAGIGLSPDGESQGVIARMGGLLYNAGLSKTQIASHAIDFSYYNAESHKVWFDDLYAVYQLAKPFIEKYVGVAEYDLEILHTTMEQEMWREDFYGIGSLYTYHAQKLG